MRRRLSKASFTVEASAVMILLLFTIISIIYLCLFIHNRAWLTAAAYETALTGSMERNKDKAEVYEKTRNKARELTGEGLYGSENLNMLVQIGSKIDVYFSQDTKIEFAGILWSLKVQGTAKKIDSVKWIRKLKAASEIMKGVD